MRLLGWALIKYDWYPLGKKYLSKDRDKQAGHHVLTEAETGVTQLQAKECQRGVPGGGEKGFYTVSQRRYGPNDNSFIPGS
jgi:hypothetical protein